MPGTRKVIPKDETYRYDGDDARNVEIRALGDIGTFIMYAAKRNPSEAGLTKTEAYVDGPRRLDARFCSKGFQEDVDANAPAPTSQLQSLRPPPPTRQ